MSTLCLECLAVDSRACKDACTAHVCVFVCAVFPTSVRPVCGQAAYQRHESSRGSILQDVLLIMGKSSASKRSAAPSLDPDLPIHVRWVRVVGWTGWWCVQGCTCTHAGNARVAGARCVFPLPARPPPPPPAPAPPHPSCPIPLGLNRPQTSTTLVLLLAQASVGPPSEEFIASLGPGPGDADEDMDRRVVDDAYKGALRVVAQCFIRPFVSKCAASTAGQDEYVGFWGWRGVVVVVVVGGGGLLLYCLGAWAPGSLDGWLGGPDRSWGLRITLAVDLSARAQGQEGLPAPPAVVP